MKCCSECGAMLLEASPGGEFPRYICRACHTVFHQNPRLAVGCLAVWEQDRVLLCRRAVNPGYDLWTLPAGFLEDGEAAPAGAMREILEEAHARIKLDRLYAVFNIPAAHQVHIVYRARLVDTEFRPGQETKEVKLFRKPEIPWGELAFATTRETLKQYCRETGNHDFGFLFAELTTFSF